MTNEIMLLQDIESKIYTIRGQRVMIDRDLAQLYGVETKRLNEAVKRNIKRFPEDFMFQLTDEEQKEVVAKCDHLQKLKYSHTNSYAFSEHGVTMLSSVLNSDRAIEINIKIVRTFIKLRQFALNHQSNIHEITDLRQILTMHIENCENRFSEHDEAIMQIIDILNNLVEKPKEVKKIGF